MSNETDEKDAYNKEPVGSAEPSGGRAEKQAGKRTDAPAEARAERASAASLERRTDHTPPPITIESGSLAVEIDLDDFTGRDDTGGQGHSRRHRMGANREIKGIRVLSVSGKSIYVDDVADGSTVEIWWNDSARDSQLFIGNRSFDIEADFDLGGGGSVHHPPVTSNVQRKRRYMHPRAGNRGIEKVRIAKGSVIIEPDAVWMVLLWDTHHPQFE